MRAPQLLGLIAMAAMLGLAPDAGAARAAAARNAPGVAATAPTPADPARTYPEPMDALLAADLDYLVTDARRSFDGGDHAMPNGMLVFLDAMAAGRWRDARSTLAAMPDGLHGDAADLFEPFLLAAEGRAQRAGERVEQSADALPAPLPDIARALLLEAAGRLPDAAALYARIEADLDVRGPLEGEPRSMEDVQRLLTANRTSNALYRAALVNHRLGRGDEARRLYGLVNRFAPHSADVAINRARLAAGRAPLEPALDARRALGRWLIFLSDHLAQTEGLAVVLTSDEPVQGLASPSSAMFLQFGIVLDPAADDWRLYAASQLLGADAYDGAERLVSTIGANSPYAAEAELTRAAIRLARHEDESAAAAAERALAIGGDRWGVLTSAGDVLRIAGRSPQAIAAFDRAFAIADNDKDRAEVLRYRAYAHRYAGDMAAAVADARAALAIDQTDDTKLVYVSILMDDEASWRDGVGVARAMFAERPDSVTRLNTLGYALIQRPEGLEEGYRLLWRGFLLGERDYAVIDSLGWAYYLHGAFDQARALIERANVLTGSNINAEILDHLGDVYWRLNRQDEARTMWREALAARPDAIRRASLERKVREGLTAPAPARRPLPDVELPTGQRDHT